MSNLGHEILLEVMRFYLSSSHFNGLPVIAVRGQFGLSQADVIRELSRLLEQGEISINFGDWHPNPHILAFPPDPPETDAEKLQRLDLTHACTYPTAKRLERVVDRSDFEGRPFTLRLALGEPQLVFQCFDLSVLEFYLNDPRYHYELSGIWGRLGVTDEFFRSNAMAQRDQVSLQTFGLAYDADGNRAVAVFLRYLSDLSPEHQQIWNARRVEGDYRLHEAYFRSEVLGEWADGDSILVAFTEELRMANEMCQLMGRPALFRNDFTGEKMPRGFGFLVRPTAKEFNGFVHLLDKMLSENIDLNFFGGDVPLEEEQLRKDGRVTVTRKGSIRLLREWIEERYRPADDALIRRMFETLAKIRRRRQRPAHAIDDDRFHQGFVREQRDLLSRAYRAVNTLRLILANHPAAQGYRVPGWIESGQIYIV